MKPDFTDSDPKTYVRLLRTALEPHADPAYAVEMKAYLRNQFEFFGMKSPLRKVIFKEFFDEHGIPSPEKLPEAAHLLLGEDEREFHYFAIESASKHRKLWDQRSVELFESMAVRRSWWDSVDYIRGVCLKEYFLAFPDLREAVSERWRSSENFWLQRLAVTFQIGYKTRTDTALLVKNIDAVKDSDEFFVQKAIGWALRDYGKTDPDFVEAYVSKAGLKPLSKREALKRIRRK
ncbi:MAG: DNA alkylation repair protein [Acidobacteriota bacterium]|nr:MAG: DNA alkylation repair protein [Acidobacteriota bacterium]